MFIVGHGRRYFHFGLATACYIFTKFMRPFNKRWRVKGIKSILYIDDGIGAKSSSEEPKIAGVQIQDDLTNDGFFINDAKSDFAP